jgi:hypothetical protein
VEVAHVSLAFPAEGVNHVLFGYLLHRVILSLVGLLGKCEGAF